MIERINIYGLIFLVGIALSAWMWDRLIGRRQERDGRLIVIYFSALIGALLGAKIGFLLAEGWHYRGNWIALLTGKTVLGALLGGYAGVEIAKAKVHFKAPTGDLFAIIAPIGLMLGRVGCIAQGCCPGVECPAGEWWAVHDAQGISRWPAAHAELTFNALFLLWALLAARYRILTGNRFHIYMIAYGLFRFGHEFARDNITVIGPIGGYHLLALALAGLGAVRLVQRLRAHSAEHPKDGDLTFGHN